MRPPPRPQRVANVGPERAASARPQRPPVPERVLPTADRVHRPASDPVPDRGRDRGPEASPQGSRSLVPADGAAFAIPVRRTVVTGSAERFAERVAMRRRLSRRKAIGAAAGLAAAMALGWLLLLSPVLALDVAEVEVRGEGTVVDPAAVLAAVQPLDGTPLPRLDTVDLRRSILDVPGVRAAQVSRVWPHGLAITVVSREPVAAVPDAAGFVLLDVDGVQVGRSAEPPAGLPVITVPVGEDTRPMIAVLTVLEQLPDDLAGQVASASAESRDTVHLVLGDGAQVEWGSADQTALKARVLQTLRAAPASVGAAVYDVSAPTLPITRTQP